MPARIDPDACLRKIRRTVRLRDIFCFQSQRVRGCPCGELERLPGIKRERVYSVACRTAEDSGQISVNVRCDGKMTKSPQRWIEIDGTGQLVCNYAFWYARPAHHPCRHGRVLSDDVEWILIPARGEDRAAVIGVETDDVFIVLVVIFDIGKQHTDIAVNIPQTCTELRFVDLKIRQTDARRRLLPGEESLIERQMRLDRRVEIEPHRIPWVDIREMEKGEEIRFAKCLDVMDGSLCTDAGGQIPYRWNQPVVAAHGSVVDAVCRQYGGGGVVPEILHAFAQRQERA